MKNNFKWISFLILFIFAFNSSYAQFWKKKKVVPKYDYQGPFYDGLAKVRSNHKYGFINKDGVEIVSPKYDQVENFSDGIARVRMGVQGREGGGWGLINSSGHEIVRPMFDVISDFINGKAEVKSLGKVGYIDRDGNLIK